MTISGKVGECDWSVSVETHPVPEGYACTIRLGHDDSMGRFEHQFEHFRVFRSEREAVLDGLREGMIWLEQKRAQALALRQSS